VGPVEPFPTIESTRLRLRPATLDDLPALVAIAGEEDVCAWWGEPDEAELREAIEEPDDAVVLVIEVGDQPAGMLQVAEEPDPMYRRAGLDIFVGRQWTGRGIGREAITAAVRHLFDDRDHHRITIDPAAANTRAIRCYEAVGFERVGVMRQYERADDGTWRDGLLLELLRDRWSG
jgi:aminoglycoside 6'-N-acetyltransferase